MTTHEFLYIIKFEVEGIHFSVEGSVDMKIQLPDCFEYRNKSQIGIAYVKDGTLYIDGVGFEAVMRAITYAIKGDDTCYYCGRELTDKNRSLDHMYPRRWGGVSIPDNLIPCCRCCNYEKDGMTYAQYQKYRKIRGKTPKKEFYQECEQGNVKILKRAKFVIERNWIEVFPLGELLKTVKFSALDKRKYCKMSAYYRHWGQYPHPVILSSNHRVLKGNHILYHAKAIGRKSVIAIVLENVVLLDKGTS